MHRRRTRHRFSALTTAQPFPLAPPPPRSRPASFFGRLSKRVSAYSRLATPGDSAEHVALSPTATLIDARRAASPTPQLPALRKDPTPLGDSIAVEMYWGRGAARSRERI